MNEVHHHPLLLLGFETLTLGQWSTMESIRRANTVTTAAELDEIFSSILLFLP
jgi:hypothetical protein